MAEPRISSPNLPALDGILADILVNKTGGLGPYRASLQQARTSLIIPGPYATFAQFGVQPIGQYDDPYDAKLAWLSQEPGNGFYDDDGEVVSQDAEIRAAMVAAWTAGYGGIDFGKGYYACNRSVIEDALPHGFHVRGAGLDVTWIIKTVQDKTLANPNDLCMFPALATINGKISALSIGVFSDFEPLQYIPEEGETEFNLGPFPLLDVIAYKDAAEQRPASFQIESGAARDVDDIVVQVPGVNGKLRLTTATPHDFRFYDTSIGTVDGPNFVTLKDVGGAIELNGSDRAFEFEYVDDLTIDIIVPDTALIGAYTSGGRIAAGVAFYTNPATGAVTFTQPQPGDDPFVYTFFKAIRSSLQSAVRGDFARGFKMDEVGIYGGWYVGARFPDAIDGTFERCKVVGIIDRQIQYTNEGRDNVVRHNKFDGAWWLHPRYDIKRVLEIQGDEIGIVSITRSNPAIVEVDETVDFPRGTRLAITIPSGDVVQDHDNMYEINNQRLIVGRQIDGTHFELFNFDTTAYTAYVSGGTLRTSVVQIGSVQMDPPLFEGAEIIIDEMKGTAHFNDDSYYVRNLDEETIGGDICDVYEIVDVLHNDAHMLNILGVWEEGTGWVSRCIRTTSYIVECGHPNSIQENLAVHDNTLKRAASRGLSTSGEGRGRIFANNRVHSSGRFGFIGLSFATSQPSDTVLKGNSFTASGVAGIFLIDATGFDLDNLVNGAPTSILLTRCTNLRIGGVCTAFNLAIEDSGIVTRGVSVNRSTGITFNELVLQAHEISVQGVNGQKCRGSITGYGEGTGIIWGVDTEYNPDGGPAVAIDYDTDITYRCSALVTRAVWQTHTLGGYLRVRGQGFGAGNNIVDAATDKSLNDFSKFELVHNTLARSYTSVGTPEGTIAAPIGSTCYRLDTGAGYRKTSGTGNTGWTTP